MAGLQYNFFPTDFFYPRPKPVAVQEANGRMGFPLQVPKTEVAAENLHDEAKPCKSLARYCSIHENKLLKAVPQVQKPTQITRLLVDDDEEEEEEEFLDDDVDDDAENIHGKQLKSLSSFLHSMVQWIPEERSETT